MHSQIHVLGIPASAMQDMLVASAQDELFRAHRLKANAANRIIIGFLCSVPCWRRYPVLATQCIAALNLILAWQLHMTANAEKPPVAGYPSFTDLNWGPPGSCRNQAGTTWNRPGTNSDAGQLRQQGPGWFRIGSEWFRRCVPGCVRQWLGGPQ